MPKQKPNEQVQQIPLSEIRPFKNHPFKVTDDELMQQTIDSIMQVGVLNPAIIRPAPEGGYEMVAGHRRHRASELAEKETMPVIVRDLDDDAATIIMVDSNLQRESLLPSERAFAYKMKLDAIKHQGIASVQVAEKLLSVEKVAGDAGESKDQVLRYIRLTYLIPELLSMVDDGKIAFNPAVELSYLDSYQQRAVLDAMALNDCTPSHAQSIRLKKLAQEGLTMLVVTHEMNFARHVSNRVVFMEGGRIIEQNSAQEFFAHPKEARTQEFLTKINQR